MARKRDLVSAVQAVGDIGSLGLDLQRHSEADVIEAVRFLRKSNPDLFDYLSRVLASPDAAAAPLDPHP